MEPYPEGMEPSDECIEWIDSYISICVEVELEDDGSGGGDDGGGSGGGGGGDDRGGHDNTGYPLCSDAQGVL